MKRRRNPGTNPGGSMRPQPHGGMLRTGGTNRGGPGRPPSLISQRCRGSFEECITVLEQIADGELGARTRDRIRAVELLGKYGMTSTPVDLQEVRHRLRATIAAISELPDEDAAAALLTTLEAIWSPDVSRAPVSSGKAR